MSGYGNGGEWNGPTQAIGGALGQIFPATGTAVERPTIGRELEHHQKASEALHQTIDLLIQRLEPVLSPAGPSTASKDGGNGISVSQVQTVLRAHGFRLDAATQRLSELIGRIEL